jgi:hypothetical protein
MRNVAENMIFGFVQKWGIKTQGSGIFNNKNDDPPWDLPKLLYFLPRLPRVLFRSPVLTPRIANSHDGNKACPRYFSMVGPKPSDRKTFPPLKSLFWGYLV